MEYAREAKIKVYVDTNKQTIEKEFVSLEEFAEWIDELDEDSVVKQALQRNST